MIMLQKNSGFFAAQFLTNQRKPPHSQDDGQDGNRNMIFGYSPNFQITPCRLLMESKLIMSVEWKLQKLTIYHSPFNHFPFDLFHLCHTQLFVRLFSLHFFGRFDSRLNNVFSKNNKYIIRIFGILEAENFSPVSRLCHVLSSYV